jgi:signal transduction histidine kinase
VKERLRIKRLFLINVEDTGIGAPQGKLEEIFERYQQADALIAKEYGGTGLGWRFANYW